MAMREEKLISLTFQVVSPKQLNSPLYVKVQKSHNMKFSLLPKKIIPLISTFLHSSSDTQFLCVYPCSHWPEKKSLFFLHPHKQPLQVIHHTGLASLYHSFCQFKLLWKNICLAKHYCLHISTITNNDSPTRD